ncbi:MAG: xylan 1,4-beta-xylosidase [Clostridiales bacterium]|nr:xylan 1,4-beta-xylosidase [Clostridiales bacterium]
MKTLNIAVAPDSRATFNNNTDFCVGTGRMGLALQKEYHDQLAMAQELCHFKHIRGHGLFSDDMAIYQHFVGRDGIEYKGYNFTYLDRVMDDYRALGLKPFLELGFMPEKMASGTQTIFYWKGNTTPPADHQKWADMIKATLRHLAERYGEEEVSTWPCEVWNEPNLPGFWEHADEKAYHELYRTSVLAVKEALPRMRVGGPAICGGATSLDWVRNFLTFCRDEKLPVDFLTRHAYMGESPVNKSRYLYHTMRTVDSIIEEMQATRDIIDSFPEYAGMEMHVTEFNTSYHPFCPIHDTNYNAALVAGLLSRMGDVCASYSYWTFGDVFEEQGVPSRPFHGGFGMIANQLIPKPTLWTFHFFTGLKGECVHKDDNCLIMKKADGSYEGVAWNIGQAEREDAQLTLALPLNGKYVLTTETVDETTCNPLKAWHDMGEPASLTDAQLRFLRQAGQPLCETRQAVDGKFTLPLRENAVVRFTVCQVKGEPDAGYDYDWYVQNR